MEKSKNTLRDFIEDKFPNGIKKMDNGYCIYIQLRNGKWDSGTCTAGIFISHPQEVEKFFMLGNKDMSTKELHEYILKRINWDVNSHI